ncbi:MAG TPA: DUF2946 family protein [Azospirillum sp.]|nr:DUF2946 family protein [Azospirillum sp.]
MSHIRHVRNALSGGTAARGSAGGGGAWRVVSAWLAVLAILVQTTVPDFAMAARNAARHRTAMAATAAAEHVHHQHQDGSHHQPEQPAPSGEHEHESLCAFCLALGTHGLAQGLGDALAVPVAYEAAALPVEQGICPPQFFLTCLNPRAPPASDRV